MKTVPKQPRTIIYSLMTVDWGKLKVLYAWTGVWWSSLYEFYDPRCCCLANKLNVCCHTPHDSCFIWLSVHGGALRCCYFWLCYIISLSFCFFSCSGTMMCCWQANQHRSTNCGVSEMYKDVLAPVCCCQVVIKYSFEIFRKCFLLQNCDSSPERHHCIGLSFAQLEKKSLEASRGRQTIWGCGSFPRSVSFFHAVWLIWIIKQPAWWLQTA